MVKGLPEEERVVTQLLHIAGGVAFCWGRSTEQGPDLAAAGLQCSASQCLQQAYASNCNLKSQVLHLRQPSTQALVPSA